MLVKGGKSRSEAEILAQKFEGFGPNLWLNDCETWIDWFGKCGEAIYILLQQVRGEEGAVPNIVLNPLYQGKEGIRKEV